MKPVFNQRKISDFIDILNTLGMEREKLLRKPIEDIKSCQ